MCSTCRRHVHRNLAALGWVAEAPNLSSFARIKEFHQTLPGFFATKSLSLPSLATELGVKDVLVKDETSRLGLPAFKILGASWAVYRAIIEQYRLPPDASLETVSIIAKQHSVKLFAATDGNHGRAVARMASLMGIQADIFVPEWLDQPTRDLIKNEGAQVTEVPGNYDDTILASMAASKAAGGLLIQDHAFGDYTKIPEWIVDGYTTMLEEIDSQRIESPVSHIIVPIGVGSLGQAVARHSKSAQGFRKTVISVEPDTAACLWESLQHGKPTSVETKSTIMSGLNCGTLSANVWSCLSSGIDASVTVSDFEAHEAVQYLLAQGISAGPCGGATLAALRVIARTDLGAANLRRDSVVVLLCTEGAREYTTPEEVSSDD